jgi:hypothetical protein
MITRNLILDFATFTRTEELTLAEKTSLTRRPLPRDSAPIGEMAGTRIRPGQ